MSLRRIFFFNFTFFSLLAVLTLLSFSTHSANAATTAIIDDPVSLNDPLSAGNVTPDNNSSTLASRALSALSPSPDLPLVPDQKVYYGVSIKGLRREAEVKENPNDPKGITTKRTLQRAVYLTDGLQDAKFMGWNIGFATATNGRGYPNQDNFLIRFFSEVEGKKRRVGESEEEGQQTSSGDVDNPSLRPTFGIFVVCDGHGDTGHQASKMAISVAEREIDHKFANYTHLVEQRKKKLEGTASFDEFMKKTIRKIFRLVDTNLLASENVSGE